MRRVNVLQDVITYNEHNICSGECIQQDAIDHFYRAMRMHSAIYAVVRCLSVRLSVCHTGVSCRNNRAHHQSISTGL